MLYLLDTNAVSDLINNHPRLVDRLNKIVLPDQPIICPIVRGEILYGIERLPVGRRRTRLLENAHPVLQAFRCVSIGVADAFSSTKCACEMKGISMPDNDLWIAAAAFALKAVLVTRDGDYSGIPGIQVEDWTL